MIEFRLYIGNRFTGITVRPDSRYPSMYRIHRPGQQPSDMVNLTRAKDAAMGLIRGQGGNQGRQLKWYEKPAHQPPHAIN